MQRKMERLIRQRSELSFSEVCTETQALEKEQNRKDEAQAARVVAPSPTDMPGLNRWKEEVKAELKKEMHDQLAIISKTLTEEVRRQLSPIEPANTQSGRREPPRGVVEHGRYQRQPRSGGNFQLDSSGRPICRACGKPGHIQRYCDATAHASRRNPLN